MKSFKLPTCEGYIRTTKTCDLFKAILNVLAAKKYYLKSIEMTNISG